ncbi:UNVERIFIED_CONTAM: hypothetical protein Slati_3021600 [Sesamum latifolium]|uniref:Uncharacterized protein n=1 Tax=Sesamum latifolium TaxID=2727402 RepID=A0AAW2VGS9_9LAMI
MGQSLNKFGNEEKKVKKIGPVIDRCYDTYFVKTEDWSSADLYHAVCQTVEEINKAIGSTQFRVPQTSTLQEAYNKHHKGKGKSLKKEEFQAILQEVILDTGLTSIASKDMLFYLFGVPATALFFKQRLAPNLVPNEAFIPIVTSATVFLLAKLSKI